MHKFGHVALSRVPGGGQKTPGRGGRTAAGVGHALRDVGADVSGTAGPAGRLPRSGAPRVEQGFVHMLPSGLLLPSLGIFNGLESAI
jgi:hypothetical protein